MIEELKPVFPKKVSVVGTPISLTDYDEVLRVLEHRPADTATAVAVCNVHSVMTARREPEVESALHQAQVATPDGMPLVWVIRSIYRAGQTRVYGPELMRRAMQYGLRAGWRHYLYGASEDTMTRLVAAIRDLAPGVALAGYESPPYRPVAEEDLESTLERIRTSKADIVWVGLGMPKQELWIARVRDRLPGVALLGVGAAFDLLAGTVRQAPAWMQQRGLEWLFRLIQEPRRLWRRYLWNNPAFVLLATGQVARSRLQLRRTRS